MWLGQYRPKEKAHIAKAARGAASACRPKAVKELGRADDAALVGASLGGARDALAQTAAPVGLYECPSVAWKPI